MPSNEEHSKLESASLQTLTKKRGIFKGKLTLFRKYLNSITSKQPSADQLIELKLRTDRIRSVFDDYEKCQDEIEIECADYEAQLEEREAFEKGYYEAISLAMNCLQEETPPETNSSNITIENKSESNDNIKYPEIILPTYCGDIKQWMEFRDTFDAIINQSNLKSIQKYKYLRTCLKDSALEVIASLEFNEDSYDLAWKLLCERYNNPRIIIKNHLAALFDIETVSTTATALRSLIDNISKHLRTIKSLNVDIENWDLLIIYFLSSKLDPSLQRKWEEKVGSKELPNLQDFKTFLRAHADLLDTLKPNINQNQPSDSKQNVARKTFLTTARTVQEKMQGNPINRCPNCNETHYISQCPKFLALSVDSRIRTIKKFRLCLNCFRSNHLIQNCKASRCKTCNGKHHSLIHNPTFTQRFNTETNHIEPITHTSTLHNSQSNETTSHSKPNPNVLTSQSSISSLAQSNNEQFMHKSIILSTALVNVKLTHNMKILRVLLDTGSQSNFITQRAYEILNLPKQPIDVEVRGFNNSLTNIKYFCNLTVHSRDNTYSTDISCFIVPNLCQIPKINIENIIIPSKYRLADEHFYRAGEIDIIIGAEQFYNLLCIGQHRLGKGLPILQKTRLGWVISGPVPMTQPNNSTYKCNFVVNNNEGMKLPDDDTKQCEKVFRTHSRATDGSFIVTIPLKKDPSSLGKSRHIAYKRLKALEIKFKRNPDFKERYINVMREFERGGHMTKVRNPPDGQHIFLPHHAVVNHEKTTTPLRVVYDASCQTDNGLSLNDIQYKGDITQDELLNILLRFRINTFVVCADIKSMYTMIHINPNQRNLQCILWRENPDNPIDIYTLNTLSFGLKCAPHLATRCLLQLAHENKALYPDAAEAIMTGFYIDDLNYSGENEDKIIETVRQIDCILKGANFHLRKWRSNSPTILEAVSTVNTNTTDTQVSLGNSSSKVLGLVWCHETDNLKFNLKSQPIVGQLTKRKLLSILSSIFDPLGLITPVLITGKIFIQKLFADKAGWDEPLPTSLVKEWEIFYENIFTLNSLYIPRHAGVRDCTRIELHGFGDSSMSAYGAVIYIKSIDKHGKTQVRLLCSKSRVARKETIPKLELRSSVLLSTLYDKVKNASKITFHNVYLWSDSTIVLAWINNSQPEKLPQFISNRINQIHELTNTSDWHWVSSRDNPADLISRGLPATELNKCVLWWQGPSWLQNPQSEWPQKKAPQIINSEVEKEIQTICYLTIEKEPNLFMQNLFNKYSSGTKLVRVFAHILRYIHNLRVKNNKLIGPLSVIEINNSLNKLIQFSQIESFPKEYDLLQQNKLIPKKSNLLDLSPFMENGIMRVGGRLSNSNYPYDKKHPAILHHKHPLTILLVRDKHAKLFHAGPQLLLSSVREQFWPTHGKSLVNKIVHSCSKCFRANPQTTSPIMGNLPAARVTPSPIFSTTSIDYAGPYTLRDRRGRGYKCYKCYIAIFVCFSTKAIHIELISSLESQAFISALRRFIARRGKPQVLVSDNATTFVGANNELTELSKFLNFHSDEIVSFNASEGITWKFLPVYTPHMGGLHEAAVKSCKYHLKRVIGQALLTYEEFLTYLIQIEGILNSRPLCPIPSSNSDDILTLTPAHFLIGRSPTCLPDYDYREIPANKLNHYQQIQQMRQDFWRRWSRDYISLLQQRTRWRAAKGPRLSVGTVVMIKDDRQPPCYWQLGRVIKTHDGQDDVTRVVTLKTQKGIIKRAFNTICILPLNGID